MEYPSFIWEKGIGENRSRCPIIPENVPNDLKIVGLVRGELQKYVLIPCDRSEIEKRQALFRALFRNPMARDALSEMENAVFDFKKSLRGYEISETGTEKALFFAVFASSFLDACACLASLDGKDSVFASVSEFFRTFLQTPFMAELSAAVEACFAVRGEHVRLKISDGSMTAAEVGKPMQQQFAEWFRLMEIEEELPKTKALRRPDSVCLEAYASIYSSFSRKAYDLHGKYRESLLGEQYHIRDFLFYGDEIAFLTDAVRYLDRFGEMGYPLCYPSVSAERKIEVTDLVDAALVSRGLPVSEIVPNDVEMVREKGGERLNFFILSGANGGGKTIYLRSVGSCVLMFLLGLPVTAKGGEIYPFRQIFTHFPSNESFQSSGRFVDEERRVKAITDTADCDTVALFNETYSGTDERKSEEHSRRLILDMAERGVFGLFVTHIHELTSSEFGEKIPVLCAEVDESDGNKRTYRIRRAESTHSSYAQDILKKYRLDRESLAALEEVR